MKGTRTMRSGWFGGAMLILALGGCVSTSPPVALYSLSPTAEAPGADAAIGRGLAVGVGPVTLASFLDRTQIVSRRNL